MESELSKGFKVAFFTLLGLTLFFILLAVVMSLLIAEPTKSQSSIEELVNHGGALTLPALLGLLTGRVA